MRSWGVEALVFLGGRSCGDNGRKIVKILFKCDICKTSQFNVIKKIHRNNTCEFSMFKSLFIIAHTIVDILVSFLNIISILFLF